MSDRSYRTSGTLSICIEAGFVPAGPLAELFSSFSLSFPGISFSLKLKSAQKIREHLISGETNLAISRSELSEDSARQYDWFKSSLHLLCSERDFASIKTAEQIALKSKVDTDHNAPVLTHLFKHHENESALLQDIYIDRICSDRHLTEALIRNGLVGALPLAAHESLPTRTRALDHIVTPASVDIVFNVRKKDSRDLIETLFIEHFLEYIERQNGLEIAV